MICMSWSLLWGDVEMKLLIKSKATSVKLRIARIRSLVHAFSSMFRSLFLSLACKYAIDFVKKTNQGYQLSLSTSSCPHQQTPDTNTRHSRVQEALVCEMSNWFPLFDKGKLTEGLGSVFGPRPPFDNPHQSATYTCVRHGVIS